MRVCAAPFEARPSCFLAFISDGYLPAASSARARARALSLNARQSPGPGDGGFGGFATVTLRKVIRFGRGRGGGGFISNSGMTLGRPAHPHVVVRPLLRLSARATVAPPHAVHRQCHRAPPPLLLGALLRTRRLPKRLPVSSTALRTAPSEHRLGFVRANAPRRIHVIWPPYSLRQGFVRTFFSFGLKSDRVI
jgi:hypothetical protein